MQHKKLTIGFVYLIVLLSSISFASAGDLTLDEFIESFDFDFNIGDINITAFNDTMVDRDGDGTNETLVLNLTTEVTVAGTYLFLADVVDSNDPVGNFSNETLDAGIHTVNITMNTTLLSDNRWNYTISIYNETGVLVYRKDKNPTKEHFNYDAGIGLSTIADGNFQNKEIQVNLTLTDTNGETLNITVFLETENFTIFGTGEETLGIGNTVVSIHVDNETIKATHYVGSYNVTRVEAGEKVFARNHVTNSYDFRDFAQTSYLDSFLDGMNDTNGDSIGEWLQLNVTAEIKQTGTYVLDMEVRDLFDEYVTNITNTQTFAPIGQKTFIVSINGTEIYQSKVNGPYVLSYARLEKDGETVDFMLDAYITSLYFFDNFTQPPLPDVTVNMSVHFDPDTLVSSLGINISNIGQAPAFNVFLDAFDNEDFENTTFVSMLDVGEIQHFRWNISNSADNRIHTAIVDFEDFIEESNESNNVASTGNKPPVLDPIGNKSTPVNYLFVLDVNATDPENDPLTYGTNGSYDSFDPDTGLFQWTPDTSGSYSVLFNVTDGNSTDEEIIGINVTGNGPPVLSSIGNKIAFVNIKMSINLSATDPDNDPLVFGHNAVFGDAFNETTGQFNWTPNATGNYPVRFSVTDGEFVDEEDIIIIVKNMTTVDPFPRIVTGNTHNSTPWRGNNFFIDRFENYNVGDDATVVYNKNRGIWVINSTNDENGNPTLVHTQNNVTQPANDDTYETLIFPATNFTNFTMTIKWLRKDNDDGPGTCGLFFRVNDTVWNTTFTFGKNHTKGYGHYIGGGGGDATANFNYWSPIFKGINSTVHPISNNTWYWMRIVVYGDRFEFFNSTDGQTYAGPVFIGRDRNLTNGTIGIYSDHGYCQYDDLMVVEHLLNASNSSDLGLAHHTENLTGVYMYSDPEGFNQTNVTFEWYNTGKLNFTQVNTNLSNINSTVHHSKTNKGDLWQFIVTFCTANQKCRSEVSNKVLITNDAPTMNPLENQTIFIDHLLTIDANADDPNNDPLNYSHNATFGDSFDSETGIYTWTPNATGTFTIEFQVTDGSESDEQSIVIHVLKIANETEGRIAIEQGINSSLNVSNRTIFTDQQIYIRYEDDDQKLGRFDKFVNSTLHGQRWAFNYNTTDEIFTNMTNISTIINIWEFENMTAENITAEVSLFINRTKT